MLPPSPRVRLPSARLRRRLLAGTALAGGVFLVAGAALALDITEPRSNTGIPGFSDNSNDADAVVNVMASVGSTDHEGIQVSRGFRSVSIDVRDNGSVSGASRGVDATSVGGAVLVTGSGPIASTGTPSTESSVVAIYALSGTGAVSIAGSGTTTSANGTGIYAAINDRSASADIHISRSGDLTANQNGIGVSNVGSGAIVIAGIGKVTSKTGTAIVADSYGGDVSIGVDPAHGAANQATRDADKLSKAIIGSSGINASTSGPGSIAIATTTGGTVTGTGGAGIQARVVTSGTDGGNITIDVGADVTGTTRGILSSVEGSGAIHVTTRAGATVTGQTSAGIVALSGSGSITIDGDGSVSGGIDGIVAQSGSGSITIDGSGAVVGGSRDGIKAYSTTGSITISGTGTTSSGINAEIGDTGSSSDITITRSGAITGAISTYNFGTGRIDIHGIGSVTSTDPESIGIYATANGDVDIGGDTGLTGAIRGAAGISASSTANVTVRVGQGGSVTETSTDTETGYAIRTEITAGKATIVVDKGGTVDGRASGSGVVMYYRTGGRATLTNAGTIYGSIAAISTSAAAKAMGAETGAPTIPSTSFTNSGTIVLADGQSVTGFGTLENADGGVLTGTGDFGDVHAAKGSVLRPGDRGGTTAGRMTVGALTMEEGSTLQLRATLSKADGGSLSGDSVHATGAVVLKGAMLAVQASPATSADWQPYKVGLSYTVVSSDVSLKGSMVAKTDLAFLTPTVKVDEAAKKASLTLTPKGNVLGSGLLTGGNQQAVYAVLAPYQAQTLSGRAQVLLDGFNNLSQQRAPAALEQLSGSAGSAGQNAAFSGGGLTGGTILQQALVAGGVTGGGAPSIQGGATGYAPEPALTGALKAATPKDARTLALNGPGPAETWRLWTTMLGAQSTTDARAGLPRVTGNDWGLAAGLDYVVDPSLAVGLAAAGTSSRFSADHGAVTGVTDGFHVAAYGTATSGPLYVAGSLGYARFQTDAARRLPAFLPDDRYAAHYGSDGFTGQAEIGWRAALGGGLTLTPLAGLQASLLHQAAYAETVEAGTGAAALSSAARDVWSVPGQLGLQAEWTTALDSWQLTVRARGAWVHEFNPERTLRSSFLALPGSSFSTRGVAATENSARLTAGVTLASAGGASFFATLTSDLAPHAHSVTAQGGLKIGW